MSHFICLSFLTWYLCVLIMGTGCEPGTINVGYADLPADPRFEGRYISVPDEFECGPTSEDTCETTIVVSHVSERAESDEGGVRYHSGIITLYARQTGTFDYQDWDVLQMNGTVVELGRATGTLVVFITDAEPPAYTEYEATVTLEGAPDACPGTIRVITDEEEIEITAERIGDCL